MGEQLVAEEDRSTHFLAVRITDPDVVSNLRLVQESIATHEPILGQCCMKPNLFHLTIGMLRLEGPDGLVAARALMERLRPVVEEMFRIENQPRLRLMDWATLGNVLFTPMFSRRVSSGSMPWSTLARKPSAPLLQW